MIKSKALEEMNPSDSRNSQSAEADPDTTSRQAVPDTRGQQDPDEQEEFSQEESARPDPSPYDEPYELRPLGLTPIGTQKDHTADESPAL